ncbi:MAG: hypothetical protein AAFX01_02055 [Cyanobacteria bacterium J06638_28]
MRQLTLVTLLALWIMAIAIIAVQNATPVAIQFLTFQSVALPFGVVLSFCAALGMLMTAALLNVPTTRKK